MRPEEIFPYPTFREGQEELAGAVYRACKNGNRFVAEAMSGFGKTAAVLAGAISAATEDGLDIVYVCRTKRQVLRVLEELGRFSTKTPLQFTSLFSKYDYCLLRQTSFGVSSETFKWFCSFKTSNNLCSYFMNFPLNRDKVESLVEDQTRRASSISELLRRSTELHVCPYEVARLALARSKITVTTYHYMLDESSRPVLIPSEKPLDSVIAVIDEAHNVRDFISGNSMTRLSFSEIKQCINDSHDLYLQRISSALTEIEQRLVDFCSNHSGWRVDKNEFVAAVSGAHGKDWLSELVFELSTNAGVAWYSVATNRNLPPSLTKVGEFLSTLLSSLTNEDIILSKSDSALFLVDTSPSSTFLKATSGFKSLILLSATVNPTDLFLRSIGLEKSSTTVHTTIKNYKFQIRTVIDGGVTTRFKMRTAEMFTKIAERAAAVCDSIEGSIGIFFPSYSVLESTRALLIAEIEHTQEKAEATILVESPGLTNEDSEKLMNSFKSSRGSILLAVQGGRFSEGEDFPGEGMDVSMVVGLSLPPPSPPMNAEYLQLERKHHFNKHQAYMVLSLLPALRKAFQCAGRHVRNPGKVGMVFFLDSRFAAPGTIELMPSWIKEDLVKGDFPPSEMRKLTREFFAKVQRR